jgi:4-diphosphocytidyl-2-C-methyl-D-erythritol kinase
VKARLKALGLYGVLMSGSGSAFFGFARDLEHAKEVVALLRRTGYARYGTLGGAHGAP